MPSPSSRLPSSSLLTKPKDGAVDHQKVGRRISLGLVAIVGVMTFSSVYMIHRTDRMGQKLGSINQVYIPTLKHLNLFHGKFTSYRRSLDQYIQFTKWGEKNLEMVHPRMNLKRILEHDLQQLQKYKGPLHAELMRELLAQINAVTDREAVRLADLAVLVKAHQIEDAARIYMDLKRDHGMVGHSINTVIREMELSVDELQLSVDRELQHTTLVILALLAASLVCTLTVGFRMRRWLLPLMEWRLVAAQMARHIAASGFQGLKEAVKLPQVTRSTPPEIVLLTRELGNMATTLMEHEKTIHFQKVKLEVLNKHLKNQNESLRKLGSLNERILNAMSAGVIVVDADGKVEQFNDRFCESFKVSRDGILGKEITSVLSGFAADQLKGWLEALENIDQWRVKYEGGQVYNVHVQLLPVGVGDMAGHVLSFEDVTALVISEDRLAHAEKLVLAGQMSAQVAHEVRNPLNSIMLQLEMLEEDISTPLEHPGSLGNPGNLGNLGSRKRIAQIAQQVERLERMTCHYLDVGKGMGLDLARCAAADLHELLEKTLDFCSAEIQARGVMVELKFDATRSVVNIDGDRMTQVLLNLLRNALEAMESAAVEHPRLVIQTSESEGELIVSVKDNGPGLSRQIKQRLFEPFVTSKASGHGLGLSLARQACLDHGGELNFVDQDQGACFEVRLPC